MTEPLHHECGIALVRLRQPLQYYIDKYGTGMYAASRMYLLMEKQHNRGQDGAGVASIKLGADPGMPYINRLRSVKTNAIADIFNQIHKPLRKAIDRGVPQSQTHEARWLQENIDFTGELWLGHLRYGTHGDLSAERCHPFLRQNNWRTRALVLAGNFNMTNVEELFGKLLDLGQHPRERADTVTVMEKIGHFLDRENQRLFDLIKAAEPDLPNTAISDRLADELDIARVLERSVKDFDGGYAMCGLLGHGAAFVARDPGGIRPAYYYEDEEVVVVASEKPAIKTVFNVDYDRIHEIPPAHALILDRKGGAKLHAISEPAPRASCSFERIYFSRGSDPEIYRERKALGRLLTPQILETIGFDLERTVFSYIPNTAETAFLGLMDGVDEYLRGYLRESLHNRDLPPDELERRLALRPRIERLVNKDVKLRTFITGDESRQDLVGHVYDVAYEVIEKRRDTIVVLDDSIVRGTTLERSILTMLDRLEPRRIVIVSSAPQIRYPDCYGIDMSRMRDFVAFRALIRLLERDGATDLLTQTYDQCLSALEEGRRTGRPVEENYVAQLYDRYTYDDVSAMIAEIVRPASLEAELTVVYQTVEGLHQAIPKHPGDWYFTGRYPTPGGYRVVNRAFVNFMEGKTVRAY